MSPLFVLDLFQEKHEGASRPPQWGAAPPRWGLNDKLRRLNDIYARGLNDKSALASMA